MKKQFAAVVAIALCAGLAGCANEIQSVAFASYEGTAAAELDEPLTVDVHPFGFVRWLDDQRISLAARMYSNCEAVPVAVTAVSSRELTIDFVPSQEDWPCTGAARTVTYEFVVPSEISRTRPVVVNAFRGRMELKAEA